MMWLIEFRLERNSELLPMDVLIPARD
jgi:hypothetical protein